MGHYWSELSGGKDFDEVMRDRAEFDRKWEEKKRLLRLRGADWRGEVVPEGETDDTVIQVWQVTPHPDGEHTHAVIRSWSDVNQLLSRVPELYLDNAYPDECREGATITVKLVDMKLSEYRETEAKAG